MIHVVWAILKQWDEGLNMRWTDNAMIINPYTLEIEKK